ncbi:regulator of sigma E protease [Trypanosoma cruzi]|nr:regulator of sigma E protease [Trypanosoma cruzi]
MRSHTKGVRKEKTTTARHQTAGYQRDEKGKRAAPRRQSVRHLLADQASCAIDVAHCGAYVLVAPEGGTANANPNTAVNTPLPQSRRAGWHHTRQEGHTKTRHAPKGRIKPANSAHRCNTAGSSRTHAPSSPSLSAAHCRHIRHLHLTIPEENTKQLEQQQQQICHIVALTPLHERVRRRRESIAQETEKSPTRHPRATRWQPCRGCPNATTTNSAATTEPCTLTHSVFSQSEQQGQKELRHTTHSAAEHPKHTQPIKNGCKKSGMQKKKRAHTD